MIDYTEKVLGNKIALATLRHLWTSKGGATGRAIAAAIDFSPQAVHQALKLLEECYLVMSRPVGRANYYEINRKHFFITDCLSPIWETTDSWLELVGQFYLENLNTSPLSILVFGSYAKGEADTGSDLDLLIIYADDDFSPNINDEILSLDSALFMRFGIHPSCKSINISKFKKDVKAGEGLMRTIYREGKSIAGHLASEVIHYDSKKT